MNQSANTDHIWKCTTPYLKFFLSSNFLLTVLNVWLYLLWFCTTVSLRCLYMLGLLIFLSDLQFLTTDFFWGFHWSVCWRSADDTSLYAIAKRFQFMSSFLSCNYQVASSCNVRLSLFSSHFCSDIIVPFSNR